jgi:Protein of unknown function (DUF1264)
MRRRDLLTTFGAAAAGLALGDPLLKEAAAAPHGGAAGAKPSSPLDNFHAYLCAFHIGKANPKFVVEAHHYCMSINDEVHQCVITDSADAGARVLGVEYIISDRLYRGLPEQEKKYYHPHTYEITSGLLIAPNLSREDEAKFMAGLLTTWGKTWHTWPDPTTELPMGDPMLMWAATNDSQISQKLLADRDRKFKMSTTALRRQRAHLGPVPQIDAPKSINTIGRQWTNEGPDKPQSRSAG